MMTLRTALKGTVIRRGKGQAFEIWHRMGVVFCQVENTPGIISGNVERCLGFLYSQLECTQSERDWLLSAVQKMMETEP